MTNFDIFAADPQFEPFASVAVSAERILHIDPSACVLNCRRAMEFAVKWMYSVDKALVMPYQDSLVSLMNTEDFRDIVGADIWRRMDFIRRIDHNIHPFPVLFIHLRKKHHTAACLNPSPQQQPAPFQLYPLQFIIVRHRIIRPFEIVCRIQPLAHSLVNLTMILRTADHKMSVLQCWHTHSPH